MIEIRNLTRKYGDVVAVDGVSLSIERGQIVGLLGHNGAGKTTVMKMLTGYLEPSAGTIRIDGIDVVAERASAQRRIGYLPESAPLYPEMLVQDYLRTMAGLRCIPESRIDQAVITAARRTGLMDRLTQPIGTLSKGYRQRVGLAQAIVHEPDVLILDEPTNGLDPTQIRSIRDLVLELGKHATVLLSTHILQEVEAVCDRVVVLIGGRLAADAPLAELTGGSAIRVSIGSDDPAARTRLAGIPGVTAVEALGRDPHRAEFFAWRLDCAPGSFPIDAVISCATDAGWPLGGVAPETRTLDAVFRELEAQHVAQEVAA